MAIHPVVPQGWVVWVASKSPQENGINKHNQFTFQTSILCLLLYNDYLILNFANVDLYLSSVRSIAWIHLKSSRSSIN